MYVQGNVKVSKHSLLGLVHKVTNLIIIFISGTYKWVPACLSQRSIPPGALRVGTDADGEEIYAGRAPHEGDILPAKVIPSKNACYVCYGGEEVLKDQFEVSVTMIDIIRVSTSVVVNCNV